MTETIILVIIAWASFWDAVRDATGHNGTSTNWWRNWAVKFSFIVGGTDVWETKERAWHWFKWAAFYPPLVALTILGLPWELWPVASIVGWVFWQLGARACGKPWGSMWL